MHYSDCARLTLITQVLCERYIRISSLLYLIYLFCGGHKCYVLVYKDMNLSGLQFTHYHSVTEAVLFLCLFFLLLLISPNLQNRF